MSSPGRRDDGQLCHIASLIKGRVLLLMQLLTNEPAMREFNMQIITTKCLNTSAMLMMLMIGEFAVRQAQQCAVGRVKGDFEAALPPQRAAFGDAAAFRAAVLRPAAPGERRLHYVMLTDGQMEMPDARPPAYFPGHVFVIESVGSGSSGFNLYQSYINAYDLDGHVEHRGGRPYLSRAQMTKVLGAVVRFVGSAVWTRECSADFALLTHIDPGAFDRPFLGAKKASVVLFCHREVIMTAGCTGALRAYIARKAVEVALTPRSEDGRTFGDASKYGANGQRALTVGEVRAGIAGLLAAIDRHPRRNIRM